MWPEVNDFWPYMAKKIMAIQFQTKIDDLRNSSTLLNRLAFYDFSQVSAGKLFGQR